MMTQDIHNDRVAITSGMVSAQANCSLDEALDRMDAYALVMSQTIEWVAVEVTERRIHFGQVP